ncbi:MAG: hypothetical protein K1Y02_21035 [Candidatus Hydrogenedentes bacterium]|nr:hypothetical protein [Candidatus Hydrogenedentota bacterium]
MHHLVLALTLAAAGGTPVATISEVPGQAELDCIEIQGVAAGVFDDELWDKRALHFVPDLRMPLLEPRRGGPFRNIYAPSAVPVPEGWRVFYGAWDGSDTGNDQIYSTPTKDFLDFGPRDTVIGHGVFTHVCNVNAFRNDDGRFEMMCTAYPDANGKNKPAYFSSPDGQTWNGAPAPYQAAQEDVVTIDGYANYPQADINGVNVLFREGDTLRLYFNDYSNRGQLFLATGKDGKHYQFEKSVMQTEHAINDVKKLVNHEGPWYLMGLHMNTNSIWYSLSRDGIAWGEERQLFRNNGEEDQYIVAVGWVCQDNRVLGVLYGAGPVPELNRNRIYARWLQKRVVFVADDKARSNPERAIGPDRQLLRLRDEPVLKGRFEIYGDDGLTLIAATEPMSIKPGCKYKLTLPAEANKP